MKRIDILGCTMDIATMSETVSVICDRIQRGKFTQHVVVNAAKIVAARSDSTLAQSIKSCDLINIDGMAVVWAARILGYTVTERVAGVDLFSRLIEESAKQNFRIFLLGASESVVARVAEVCKELHPNIEIAGYHHGYFWENEQAVVDSIRASSAQLLFVAITSPKKENFINKWGAELGVSFVMGVGGTFDVIAGKVRRAPRWMQNSGLEWFYRVIQEPRRMFRRYATTNACFIYLVGRAWISKTLLRRGRISSASHPK